MKTLKAACECIGIHFRKYGFAKPGYHDRIRPNSSRTWTSAEQHGPANALKHMKTLQSDYEDDKIDFSFLKHSTEQSNPHIICDDKATLLNKHPIIHHDNAIPRCHCRHSHRLDNWAHPPISAIVLRLLSPSCATFTRKRRWCVAYTRSASI